MTTRAVNVLDCLRDLFLAKRSVEMNDDMLCGVIETVINELRDIEALTSAYLDLDHIKRQS
jgi:hypothetical protein